MLGRVVEVASGMTFDQFLRQRIFTPLGMKNTAFHPGDDRWSSVVTAYHRADGTLTKTQTPNRLQSKTYFSGAGGLVSTAEEYAQFALMLSAGGQWNGKRLLSPKTVELMSSVFVPDTLPGRTQGRGYGLSVEVVSDPVGAGRRVSKGSFGWDGAYGTHFWVDPQEKLIGVMMIQTDNPDRQVDRDFENAVCRQSWSRFGPEMPDIRGISFSFQRCLSRLPDFSTSIKSKPRDSSSGGRSPKRVAPLQVANRLPKQGRDPFELGMAGIPEPLKDHGLCIGNREARLAKAVHRDTAVVSVARTRRILNHVHIEAVRLQAESRL